MTPLTTLGLGFLLGLRHAFDSDHLIAVSTIVTRERSPWRSLWIGLFWGIGHTATLLLVGLVVLGLKQRIPAPMEMSLECVVGVMLIGLGLMTLYDCWRKRLHVHQHQHNGDTHTHFHAHADTSSHTHVHRLRLGLRPLIIGMVHGLAGSAALMLIVLAAIPSPALGLAYIGIFGLGSVLGMGMVSLLMGIFFSLALHRLSDVNLTLRVATGVVSAVFGTWIVVDVGFVQGLFLS
ncbi:MAG: sulfite exporter TauE/SafE family protein [Candidatus Binatia bacterium]